MAAVLPNLAYLQNASSTSLNALAVNLTKLLSDKGILTEHTASILLIISTLSIFFLIVLINWLNKKHKHILKSKPVKVNCWFCNTDQYVLPYKAENGFYCQMDDCSQYNGFNDKGDYNKTVSEQIYETFNDAKFNKLTHHNDPSSYAVDNHFLSLKKLCHNCNDQQVLKLRAERDFDPSDVDSEDDEEWNRRLKIFRKTLERKFPLCRKCDDFLEKKFLIPRKLKDHITVPSESFTFNANNRNKNGKSKSRPGYEVDTDDFLGTNRPKEGDKIHKIIHYSKIILVTLAVVGIDYRKQTGKFKIDFESGQHQIYVSVLLLFLVKILVSLFLIQGNFGRFLKFYCFYDVNMVVLKYLTTVKFDDESVPAVDDKQRLMPLLRKFDHHFEFSRSSLEELLIYEKVFDKILVTVAVAWAGTDLLVTPILKRLEVPIIGSNFISRLFLRYNHKINKNLNKVNNNNQTSSSKINKPQLNISPDPNDSDDLDSELSSLDINKDMSNFNQTTTDLKSKTTNKLLNKSKSSSTSKHRFGLGAFRNTPPDSKVGGLFNNNSRAESLTGSTTGIEAFSKPFSQINKSVFNAQHANSQGSTTPNSFAGFNQNHTESKKLKDLNIVAHQPTRITAFGSMVDGFTKAAGQVGGAARNRFMSAPTPKTPPRSSTFMRDIYNNDQQMDVDEERKESPVTGLAGLGALRVGGPSSTTGGAKKSLFLSTIEENCTGIGRPTPTLQEFSSDEKNVTDPNQSSFLNSQPNFNASNSPVTNSPNDTVNPSDSVSQVGMSLTPNAATGLRNRFNNQHQSLIQKQQNPASPSYNSYSNSNYGSQSVFNSTALSRSTLVPDNDHSLQRYSNNNNNNNNYSHSSRNPLGLAQYGRQTTTQQQSSKRSSNTSRLTNSFYTPSNTHHHEPHHAPSTFTTRTAQPSSNSMAFSAHPNFSLNSSQESNNLNVSGFSLNSLGSPGGPTPGQGKISLPGPQNTADLLGRFNNDKNLPRMTNNSSSIRHLDNMSIMTDGRTVVINNRWCYFFVFITIMVFLINIAFVWIFYFKLGKKE